MARPTSIDLPVTLERATGGEVAAIADLAPKPQLLTVKDDQLGYLVVPSGVTAEQVDLSVYNEFPDRPKNTVRPKTVQALRDYVARHYGRDRTTVWVDVDTTTVTAILNDHVGTAGDDGVDPGADWRDHRAVLKLRTTPEWDFWVSKDGEPLSQLEFAEHIEEGYREIVSPDAASMLEIAQSIEASIDGSFKSKQRLTNGNVNLVYEENVTATAGGSQQIEIPEKFELLLSPLVGEDAVAMTARLRYRIAGGRLSLGYKLERPHDVLSAACDLIVETLSGDVAHVYLGTPE